MSHDADTENNRISIITLKKKCYSTHRVYNKTIKMELEKTPHYLTTVLEIV